MFDQNKYINEFAKEKYDRIPLQVPKGHKDIILQHATARGYKSINAYIKALIEEDMKKKD